MRLLLGHAYLLDPCDPLPAVIDSGGLAGSRVNAKKRQATQSDESIQILKGDDGKDQFTVSNQ
jgi:hypothetical protein